MPGKFLNGGNKKLGMSSKQQHFGHSKKKLNRAGEQTIITVALKSILFSTLFLLIAACLPFQHSAFAAAYKEICADYFGTGPEYWIPVYAEDNPEQHLSIEEFYVLDNNRQPVEDLAPKEKARLYSLARGVHEIANSDYWKIRKQSESIVREAFAEIEELRDIDAEDVLNSGASIFAGALSGCAYGGAAGAAAGGIGALPGCGLGAATLGGAAAIDEIGGYIVDAISTYDDASREEIVITESRTLMGIIYKQSGDVNYAQTRFLETNQTITVSDLDQTWLAYSEIILYSKFLNTFLEQMLPDHTELHQKINNSLAANISTFSNFTADNSNWAQGIPTGTIIKGVQHFVEWLGPGMSPAELANHLTDELEASHDEWMTTVYRSSPTSGFMLEYWTSMFEDREPAVFEEISLSGSSFNVNDIIELSANIEKLSSPYPDGQVSFEVRDNKGNTVKSGELLHDGAVYKNEINVGGSPGGYSVVLRAFDSEGNAIGKKTTTFSVNNPAEGHDLALTTLDVSKFNVEPGEDTVTVDISLRNNGVYNETPVAYFTVEGPGGYSYNGTQQTLSPIAPDFSESYNNLFSWSVPADAEDGSYTIKAEVLGQNGDFTVVDNRRFKTVYAGTIPPNTSEMMAGSGWFAYYHTQENLSQYGALNDHGMFGWVHYSANNGQTYHVAVSDDQPEEYGMVVKRGSQVIVSELGHDADFFYNEIVYVDDHLAVFVENWATDEKMIYFAEPIQNVGIEPKERSTIPNVYVDYFADLGVEPDCNFDSRDIYDARQDNDGQWQYTRDETNKLSIADIDCERSSNGYSFKLTSDLPGTHGFAVELEQRDTYYNPSISADGATGGMEVNERLVWLVGRLVVEDFNDIAITDSSIPSGRSGDVLDLLVEVSQQGTLTPSNIEMKWSITGPNNFQHDEVHSGTLGNNSLAWDTNGLPAGTYRVEASALSPGDIDAEDAIISGTIVLDPPLPTEVVSSDNTNSLMMRSNSAELRNEPTPIKSGALQVLEVELRDENETCREDGIAYAVQLDSTGEPLTVGLTPLQKVEGQCLFRGIIDVASQTTAIKIVGHLNRYDDGLLEEPISVSPNWPPVIAISHDYDAMYFHIGQKLQFNSNIFDQDGDGVSSFVWTVRSPDEEESYYSNEDIMEVEITQKGQYTIELEGFDGLRKEGDPAELTLSIPADADIDNDGILNWDEDKNNNGIRDPGETDPCNPDTDNDGIQDGTELGYTMDDISPDTDTSFFQPDLDPTTTTDPNNWDTDGDGLSDGEEDANFNGRVDPGETDPNPGKAMPWVPLLLSD